MFVSHELMQRLNAKIYAEARRLGVKWVLGGECGHMWRGLHQYMNTLNGPPDFLAPPGSPVTGTVFSNARSACAVPVYFLGTRKLSSHRVNLVDTGIPMG